MLFWETASLRAPAFKLRLYLATGLDSAIGRGKRFDWSDKNSKQYTALSCRLCLWVKSRFISTAGLQETEKATIDQHCVLMRYLGQTGFRLSGNTELKNWSDVLFHSSSSRRKFLVSISCIFLVINTTIAFEQLLIHWAWPSASDYCAYSQSRNACASVRSDHLRHLNYAITTVLKW